VILLRQRDVQVALEDIAQRRGRRDRQQRVELIVGGWGAGVVALGLGELEILVQAVDAGCAAQRAPTAAAQRLLALDLVERRVLLELLLDQLLELQRGQHEHIIERDQRRRSFHLLLRQQTHPHGHIHHVETSAASLSSI